MRLTRPWKIALTAAAALIVLAAALLWVTARTAYARNLVAGWVTEATGLPATVESLSIDFLRGPAFRLDGLAIAQPTGFAGKPLVEVASLRIRVPWSSLFGDPVAHTVSIERAVLRPAVRQDGSDNWSALIDRLTAGEEEAPAWAVGRFEVEDSAVEYEDASAAVNIRLTAITIEASDVSPAAEFPVELKLGGVVGTHTFLLACVARGHADTGTGRFAATGLNVRGWAGGDPLPLAGVEMLGDVNKLTFDGESSITSVDGGSFNVAGISGRFAGHFDLGKPERTVFSVQTASFAPRPPAVAFGMPLPRTADEKAFGRFQVSVEGRMKDGVLQLDPIKGRLDETEFSGRVVPSMRLIRASADRIEIDRYLAPGEPRHREERATLEAAVAELGEFDIDAEIRIGVATVAGARLRDTVIRVERSEGGT